jgi:hypothetical protein
MTNDRRRARFLVLCLAGLCLPACSGGSGNAKDARASDDAPTEAMSARDASIEEAQGCFPCQDYWICSGDITQIHLEPAADGCHLAELPGGKILMPDGTITEDGGVLGRATASGASVTVTYPDGGLWLYCRGGDGCPRR